MNESLSKMLKVIARIIEVTILVVGVLALMVIFHEIYHLHLDGEAVGLCIGNCNVYGEFAPAVIYWEHLKEIIPKDEEVKAWVFSFLCTSGAFLLYIFGELSNEK
jgi:hypothetical protein